MSVAPPPEPHDGFVSHVVEQYIHRLGAVSDSPISERGEALRVRALIDHAGDAHLIEEPRALALRDRAAHDLAGDPALLAAFFQNIDLLYADRFPRADAVSALILRALELSASIPRSGGP